MTAIEKAVRLAMQHKRDLLHGDGPVYFVDAVDNEPRGRWAVKAYHTENHDHGLWFDVRTGHKLRAPNSVPVMQEYLRQQQFRRRHE